MSRPSTALLIMDFAASLARRSTCSRNQVGCVLTDTNRTAIMAFGYNGNAAGLPNQCDRPSEPGNCGCIHAEMNALIKAPGFTRKHAFVSVAPCEMCAKAMVNANVAHVTFRQKYRTVAGLDVLLWAGVRVEQLTADDEWTFVDRVLVREWRDENLASELSQP